MTIEFYGDHPALDLMNSVMLVDGAAADTWQTDEDVLNWLQAAGLLPKEGTARGTAPDGLLDAGRALRETVRKMVRDRKADKPLDLRPLNAALAQAQRHLELRKGEDGKLALNARYAADTPQQLLAPLAESAAQLLVEADFSLVRKCEDADCVLWFLDRTKAHRRRWCSMALCGNRHKVASFRQRQQREA